MRKVQAGQTSQILDDFFIQDTSSTTGTGLAGLAFNTSGLTCYYHRNTANASVAVALATMTLGTWASGGLKEVDASNMPGIYSFCPPDAALAGGAQSVTFYFVGASNMQPTPITVILTAVNEQDGVHGGMSAIPNTAVTTNGSLITSGAGTDQLSLSLGQEGTIRTGTAQAGANGSITLDSGASAVDSFYQDELVRILSGIGAGQTRAISGYTGSSKVATTSPNWQTNPDNTSVFAILPGTRVNVRAWLGSSVNALVSGRVDASIGANNAGNLTADMQTIKTQAVTCAAAVTILASVGTAATDTAQTGDSYARIGAPAGASLSADIAAVNSKTTNLPAAPASTTNITAGTITTATNLTNAPTSGDFTATMKTSIGTAVAASAVASVTGAVGSVTGNIGGNVVGSVASVANISAQTGDSYAIVNNGTYGNAAIKTLEDAIAGYIDTEVAAIKAKTDNLPAAPASTTNITAGTLTTVTNLTNAPTAGDFTAAMKTSLNAATPAATIGSLGAGAITSASIANGAITDAKFTLPAVGALPDSGPLAMIQRTWRRFFKRVKNDKSGLTIKTYADDGTTVLTTQSYTVSATADDVGAAT